LNTKIIVLVILTGLFQSCDPQKESNFKPLVPDETPFIVGVLEAAQDTVHHYSEVFVSTVSNPEGFEAEPVWTTPGIWWPIVNALVTRPVTRNDLKRTADTGANVSITGPLGAPNEITVQFTNLGKGVYGDTQYKLTLEGGEQYNLLVTMSDGRQYMATTKIPELFEWEVPDTLTMELALDQYANGIYKEEDKQVAELPFSVGPDVGYIIRKANSEFDYFNFEVQEGSFLFDDRGDFLREGASYGLFDASSFPDKRVFMLGWDGNGSNPLRSSENWMLSISQLNLPLSNFYYSVFRFLGTNPGGRWDMQDQARLKALVERDNTFLFDISNVYKVNRNGEVLPNHQVDAIGVFGGYSAAYRRLTVIPQRSWDPDTLNWSKQEN
jgi:hypothetical protein